MVIASSSGPESVLPSRLAHRSVRDYVISELDKLELMVAPAIATAVSAKIDASQRPTDLTPTASRFDKRNEQAADNARAQMVRQREKFEAASSYLECSDETSLAFEEFIKLLPEHSTANHSEETLRRWFAMADSDGDGRLSMEEFFVWSLHAAARKTGAAVSATFKKYDLDHSGTLDELEFICAVEELGFGELGRKLFDETKGANRSVEYTKLLTAASVDASRKHRSQDMRAFLTALVLDSDPGYIDTSGWTFEGTDPESTRLSFVELLKFNHVSLGDLFTQVFDDDGSNLISQAEFLQGMKEDMGYKGGDTTLVEIWEDLDGDGSGTISLGELSSWTRGRNAARHALENVTLDAGSTDEEGWSNERLRLEVNAILEKNGTRAAEIIQVWDASGDNKISRKEFLVNMRNLVNDDDSWYRTIRAAVTQAFNTIDSGRDGVLSLDEITCWLEGLPPPPSPTQQKPSPLPSRSSSPTVRQMARPLKSGSPTASSHQDRTSSPGRSSAGRTFIPVNAAGYTRGVRVPVAPVGDLPPNRISTAGQYRPPSALRRWERTAGDPPKQRPSFPICGTRESPRWPPASPGSPPDLSSTKSFARTMLASMSLGVYDGQPLEAQQKAAAAPGKRSRPQSAQSHGFRRGQSFLRAPSGQCPGVIGPSWRMPRAKSNTAATAASDEHEHTVSSSPEQRAATPEGVTRQSTILRFKPIVHGELPRVERDLEREGELRRMCDLLSQERQMWRNGLRELQTSRSNYVYD